MDSFTWSTQDNRRSREARGPHNIHFAFSIDDTYGHGLPRQEPDEYTDHPRSFYRRGRAGHGGARDFGFGEGGAGLCERHKREAMDYWFADTPGREPDWYADHSRSFSSRGHARHGGARGFEFGEGGAGLCERHKREAVDDWFADTLGREPDLYTGRPRSFHSCGRGGHGGARGLGLGGGLRNGRAEAWAGYGVAW